MKQLKKPTRRQKELITKNKLLAKNWGVEKQTENMLYIRHKVTGTRRHFSLI